MSLDILSQFRSFYSLYPFLDVASLVDYFLIFGGLEEPMDIDILDGIDSSIIKSVTIQYHTIEKSITPQYLLVAPYSQVLSAIARGDGRRGNIFKRAKVGTNIGQEVVDRLLESNIIYLELSREPTLLSHPKHKVKRSLRGYNIEYKARFSRPIDRFWFGFVEPYMSVDRVLDISSFEQNFIKYRDKASYLMFEQLSTALLNHSLGNTIESTGSFWDYRSEFDIYTITKSKERILGECKYISRAVSKKEYTKLKDKAQVSGLEIDRYAIFAKSGFSKELLNYAKKDRLILFDIKSFEELLF